MKYVTEFRDAQRAKGLAEALRAAVNPERRYRLMEFCGGHTHAVFRYGVPDLLPDNIDLIHGPGCPVCVLPVGRLDMAINLVMSHPQVMLVSYGDMLRVPGSKQSLLQAKANGADVRMVYSVRDALDLARANPSREVVFFGIGFETTTPPTAQAIIEAKRSGLPNFSVFCNHVLTPAAMRAILQPGLSEADQVVIDGIIGPSHVSVVIGADAYQFCASDYNKPLVIAGFEPLDILQSILMLVQQLNEGRCEIENQYTRAVTATGNGKAQAVVAEVFQQRSSFEWRGLGRVAYSALAIAEAYRQFDAEARFTMPYLAPAETKGCECPAVLRGAKRPIDCKLFATACTPESPLGSCMVSDEGACAAYFTYGRFREPSN